MARKPKIWWRQDRQAWFVTIRGKRHNLGSDKAVAEKLFHRLMATEEQPAPTLTVAVLLDKFLAWVKANRAERTLEWYAMHLQSFLDSLPNQRLEAQAVKAFHVTEWAEKKRSKTYQRGAMGAVQRAFRWGVKQGHLNRSPIEHLEKPAAEHRDNCPSHEDYKAMLRYATEPFRSVLIFAYETGARPQEIVRIESRHIHGDTVVFPISESKGKKRKRVIYLTTKARELIAGKEGLVFLNRDGKQWTASAIKCRMRRIAKKTGKHFALYDLRHFFATRMLEAGLGHITVAKLLGHADATMLARVYQHIGESNDFLLDELKRAS